MNENTKKTSSSKMMWIYILVMILAIACFGKILHLIIFQRSLYEGTSSKCLDKTKPDWEKNPLASDSTCNCFVVQNDLKPVRGEIYDDKGRLLISNYSVFDITLDGRMLQPKRYRKGQKEIVNDTIYCGNNLKISRSGDVQKMNQLVENLATRFYAQFKDRFPNKGLDYYRKQFSRAIKEQKNVLILRSNILRERQWITSDDTAAIGKMPLLMKKRKGGLHYTIRSVRINPYGDMAKRTLGMYTDSRKYGLETAFNKQLEGDIGAQKYLYVNEARIPLNERIEPKDGLNVHSTLNLEIQNIVHNELLKILIEQNGEWGCAVVMETQTGQVKAISNLTRVNNEGGIYREGQQNYALTAMVEPGSTFKLASLLAFLERTPNDMDKKYPISAHTFVRKSKSGKEYRYAKTDGHDHAEELTFPIDVFQRSSNVGIASMVFDKYSIDNYQSFLKKIDSMYITTSFTTQLGKIYAPNIKRKASDFHSYYNACFGTGFTMTPIQTLIYFNAVANGGKMILPLFVNYVTNKDDTIKNYEAEVIAEQIAKRSTIKRAQMYLKSVITGEHGTGRNYADKSFSFAGKTGTRDIWDESTQSYLKNKNSVSFCGYFPADNPKYTAIVFIYNVPRKSSIAVKVFAAIGKAVMNTAHLAALQEVPKQNVKTFPSAKAVSIYDLPYILGKYGVSADVGKMQTPYVSASMQENQKLIMKATPFSAARNNPNVFGLTAADAVYELTKLGFKVTIYGRGRVNNQQYDMNAKTAVLHLNP